MPNVPPCVGEVAGVFEDGDRIPYIDIQTTDNTRPSTIPVFNARTKLLEESRSIGTIPSIGISAEF